MCSSRSGGCLPEEDARFGEIGVLVHVVPDFSDLFLEVEGVRHDEGEWL